MTACLDRCRQDLIFNFGLKYLISLTNFFKVFKDVCPGSFLTNAKSFPAGKSK